MYPSLFRDGVLIKSTIRCAGVYWFVGTRTRAKAIEIKDPDGNEIHVIEAMPATCSTNR